MQNKQKIQNISEIEKQVRGVAGGRGTMGADASLEGLTSCCHRPHIIHQKSIKQ